MARRPRTPKAPIAPAQDRVTLVRTEDPRAISTRVLDVSQPHAWLVGCEDATCDHKVLVAKYDYRPVSFADPDGPMIKTIYTAPGRRRCGLHIHSA